MTKRILEIGPGTTTGKSSVFSNADTIDAVVGEPTAKVTWGRDSFPFSDNIYDLVFASHVLEHVPWYRVVFALSEVYRVLKPGGEFEVYVPDFDYIVKCYSARKCGDNWRVFNPESDWMTWVNGRIFTYGEDAVELLSTERPIPQTLHKAVFNQEYLTKCLKKAGFDNCVPLSKRKHGVAHKIPEVSMLAFK